MQPKVRIYTMDHCPYCDRAKKLLQSRKVAYEEVHLAEDDDASWDALTKKSGMKTVPQIFNGETLIGGYTDLAALDQKDSLKSLL